MNYNLIPWLEFRENISTIQNFDILKFTQSFETIKIDDQSPVRYRIPEYGSYVKYNVKIMRKVRHISKIIRDESKGVSLFREVTTLLYIAFALPCGLNDKIVEPLYKGLKEIKKKGKLDYTYIEGDYYYPIIRKAKEYCGRAKDMVNKIQREADFWLEDWRTEKCQVKKIWEDTVALKVEAIR
jgi:hypothetical protein